jgi:hypothetical protein
LVPCACTWKKCRRRAVFGRRFSWAGHWANLVIKPFSDGSSCKHQVDDWFWNETLAGRFVQALRIMALRSDSNALKTVGGRFFVPARWVAE